MKPVLYVGLKGCVGHMPCGKLNEHRDLILVTSEKGSGYRAQVYGRNVHGVATHTRASDIEAKFPDLETARRALKLAAVAHDAYCTVIERALIDLQTLEATQRSAVKTAISGLTMDGGAK